MSGDGPVGRHKLSESATGHPRGTITRLKASHGHSFVMSILEFPNGGLCKVDLLVSGLDKAGIRKGVLTKVRGLDRRVDHPP